jgi:2Fe-2S iron-sulfur cluster binding domain
MIQIAINDTNVDAHDGERLIDAINRAGLQLSQVCYHPQLGPIQTCDTCIVEVDGRLVRACSTIVSTGITVKTTGQAATSARTEAFDRILRNHELYATTTMETAQSTTRRNYSRWSISGIRLNPSPTKSTIAIRFTGTTLANAFCAADVSKPARVWRSTRRSPFAGRIRIRECFGTAERTLAGQVASLADTASRSVPATPSWRKP